MQRQRDCSSSAWGSYTASRKGEYHLGGEGGNAAWSARARVSGWVGVGKRGDAQQRQL